MNNPRQDYTKFGDYSLYLCVQRPVGSTENLEMHMQAAGAHHLLDPHPLLDSILRLHPIPGFQIVYFCHP